MEVSQKILTFLDIQIFINSDRTVGTTLFRKPSVGNSLLHANSFHPVSMITNVPYGQYLRLRRNCSEVVQFELEAKALRDRLRLRGYSNKCLKKAYIRAKKQDRLNLIHGQTTPKSDPGLRIITRFSGQHQRVRDLLQKHWYLLMGDPNVSKHLKAHPEITYRQSRSIRHHIIHSHYVPSSTVIANTKGTRPCHKCGFCRHIYASRNIVLPNGRVYSPKFLATCQSIGVIYLMICECNAFYVGKTKCPFFRCIRDHVSLVLKKKMETPISRHVGLCHQFDDTKMHFYALEYAPPNEMGGDYDKILLQCETKWISDLCALQYPGLNDVLSFKPFL